MDSYKSFDDFTNLYSLSKTLRFELKPVGKTLENIEKKGMLSNDEKRAEDYKDVKKLIDLYHKNFIEKVLSKFLLSTEDKGKKDSLQEYYKIYINKNRDAKQKEDLKKITESLRKQISVAFKKDEVFARINKKELIREDLPKFLNDLNKSSILSEFNDFTSYFTGFHENRHNMYSDEEKSTAIAYRLINENLPKFIDNLKIYTEIKDVLTDEIKKLNNELKKELNGIELDNLFCIEGFNKTLTQKQIDLYNTIIGGKTENNVKIQGLNEYINLYNQQNKNQRLPKLKQLYKQILSDHNSLSWLPEVFEDDNSVLEGIENYYSDLKDKLVSKECTLKELLLSINKYNLGKIYIKNDLLKEISQKLLQNWNIIPEAVKEFYRKNNPRKPKESAEKCEERCEKYFEGFESFSIEFLNNCLKESNIKASVEDYFINLGKEKDVEKSSDLFCKIEDNYSKVKDLLNTKYSDNKKLSQDDESIGKIKELLDSIKNLQYFVKPLLGKGNEAEKDERFYGEFTVFYEYLDKITPLYNKVRNYMTKKPYSTEKMKLNFENSTLLNGWDLNKEKDNLGIILIKDGLYYLGIIDKKSNKIFDGELDNNGNCYKKMEYKLLPGPNKMLPKVFFSKSRIDEFNPSSEIKNNYDKETHKKGPNFSLKDCHALIDFFKSSIQKHEDWSKFNFKFSNTQSYEDLSGFYREVEHQGYKITFKDISENYINELVDSGKLYLFQIYNKDFSPYSKGTPNLHTLYWKMLFDSNNLTNVVYKLNGEAELFYRKSSIHYDKPTHPANQPINNKNIGNPKKQSLFAYDLIKDKRYTLDKFQFHVPITINFKATGGEFINDKVNECIRNNGIEHIIGIDRGERNLLYLSVIDLKGNIVEQYSLNEIINNVTKNGKSYSFKTDYHTLLDKREEERLKARQSWKTIEGIKDLKEGYLSQVIHKISELMIKYKAIVVMEDLNFGFMRGRQKVEKQVYQKFEQMLIDKLNYLVDKKANPLSNGGLLKAYQLTSKFKSFKELGKQSGFLFYIQAWNTSKIDPVTGFVNFFDTKYTNVESAQQFFNKFDSIEYNEKKNWFEFAFDYNKFTTKAEETKTKWIVCTNSTRIETFRNPEKNSQWDNREINLTEELKQLLAKYSIKLDGDLKANIVKQQEKGFFENLLKLFRLTVQMRNSITNSEIDYLISPVPNEDGIFYDSRNADKNLPENADANGAYNIARKGLWVLNQIKNSKPDDKKLNLAITNKEWLKYAQEKPYKK